MRVTGHFRIRHLACDMITIDRLPAELRRRSCVTDGIHVWQVIGIERHAMPREKCIGLPASLRLKPNDMLPADGAELRIVARPET